MFARLHNRDSSLLTMIRVKKKKKIMFYLHRDELEKSLEKIAAKSVIHLSTSSLCLLEHGERDNISGLSKSIPLQYSDWTSFISAACRLFV